MTESQTKFEVQRDITAQLMSRRTTTQSLQASIQTLQTSNG